MTVPGDPPGPERPARPAGDPPALVPRRPRTPGGVVYLGVLAVTFAGLLVVVLDRWRPGLVLMGSALLFGAVARTVLPEAQAGMLGVRRKFIDVVTLAVLGGGIVVLALLIPEQHR